MRLMTQISHHQTKNHAVCKYHPKLLKSINKLFYHKTNIFCNHLVKNRFFIFIFVLSGHFELRIFRNKYKFNKLLKKVIHYNV